MSRFVALPKGVSEETFAKAIGEYRQLLGETRLRTDPASLQAYLATAALHFKQKKYKDAWESASKAPQGGIQAFVLGISATRMENWGEAATQLATAADSFPLLADYALYEEARALYRLARFGDAVKPLQKLVRDFPDSPLLRPAQLLYADTLFDVKDFGSAYTAYQKFIEKYPSGTDALSAAHRSALCLEQRGDTAGAVAAFKAIWLKNPASIYASKADDELSRIAAQGVKVSPYAPEELLRLVPPQLPEAADPDRHRAHPLTEGSYLLLRC